jgi:uncharacterized protein with von Willebrand factor type A (vWA) domain
MNRQIWQYEDAGVESVFKADLFDIEDWQDACKVVPSLESDDIVASEEYCGHPVQDGFFGLYKANPEFISSEKNLKPLAELFRRGMDTPSWSKLRENSIGLLAGAALGSQHFIQNVLKNLPEEVKDKAREASQKQAQADRDQEQAEGLNSLAEMLEGIAGQNGSEEIQAQANEARAKAEKLQAQAEQAQADIEQAMANFEQALSDNEAQVTATLNQAADEAADKAEETNAICQAFGMAAGTDGHVDPETARNAMEALRLNPNLRDLADLLGWAKRMVRGEWRQSIHGNERMVGYRQHELRPDKLASSELVAMTSPNPAIQLDFQRRVIEGEVVHRHYDGDEQQGKGPMILVRDESGSMNGPKHSMAVALEWALLEIARKDNRPFYSIPFSGSGQYQVWKAPEKGQPDLGGLLTHLSHFYGGGTEPYCPIAAGLSLAGEQEDRADILVLTDECFTSPAKEFLDQVKQVKDQVDTKIVTVTIGGGYGDIAEAFSDKHLNVQDLLKDKDRLREAVRELV